MDARIEWKDEYAIGIKEIDSQHKELVSLFSKISGSIQSDLPWSEIHFQIVELKTFATFHFEFEEALMRLFGYTEHETHADAHQVFFDKLHAIEQSSIRDEVKQEVVRLAFDWLFAHIATADKAYAKHILGGAAVVKS